jgi:secreted trypsin-like serine protease
MVGGATPVSGDRAAVMITGQRGFCTGTMIARDLVLTAAHCVSAGGDHKLIEFDANRQPVLRDIARIAIHPQFNMQTFLNHLATADVALLKLAAPMAAASPVPMMIEAPKIAPGDQLVVGGYGITAIGNEKSSGTLRSAALVATGKPGNLQIRLVDPTTNGTRAGLGACTGDSGGPAFQERNGQFLMIGVVSWVTGPNGTDGCGGLTGVTPLSLYRGWIVETARKLGSPIAP